MPIFFEAVIKIESVLCILSLPSSKNDFGPNTLCVSKHFMVGAWIIKMVKMSKGVTLFPKLGLLSAGCVSVWKNRHQKRSWGADSMMTFLMTCHWRCSIKHGSASFWDIESQKVSHDFSTSSLYSKSQYSCKQTEKSKWVIFVCTCILIQLGHEECSRMFKAETQTVESSLLDMMCMVRRRTGRMKWEEERESHPFWEAFDWRGTVPGWGLSAWWVTWGRCWPLLGLQLEADTGSRHWRRRTLVPGALKLGLRDLLCCWLQL